MKEEMKPTNAICSVDPHVAQVIELPSHLPICQMLWPADERSEKETFANTELIAEVFTVYHETGLTPREILAQRDELLKACGEFFGLGLDDGSEVREIMERIQNTTPEPVTH